MELKDSANCCASTDARQDLTWRNDSQRLIGAQGSVQVRRVFGKTGHLQAYLWSDLFTSLVDAHWRRILSLGALVYIFVWVLFGILYWSVMNFSVEIEESCHKLKSFSDAFLLSIDTQTSIGFGNYSVDSDCTPGIYILVLQCLVSILLDAAYMGLIFAKISRPQHRSNTVIFSKHACIADAGGESYLMIRVADQRKNQVLRPGPPGERQPVVDPVTCPYIILLLALPASKCMINYALCACLPLEF